MIEMIKETKDDMNCAVQMYKNNCYEDKPYKEQKNHPNWYSHPDTLEGWISWPDLFGKYSGGFLSLPELKKEVQALGIKSHDEYKSERKNHPNWHSNILEGWISWSDFWGKKCLSF